MWSDGSGKLAKRFSYLLLQEGEYYIQDWIATCKPPRGLGMRAIHHWHQLVSFKGRLRLCSKSIFFEPDDISIPILMFPLNKVNKIEQLTEGKVSPKLAASHQPGSNAGFVLEVSLLVRMKKNGIDAPYEFDKAMGVWWFCLDYAPVHQFMQQALSLWSVNSLQPSERDMVLRNSAAQKEAQAQFDISRLEDFNESILFNYPAAQMTPLIREPGRLVLTPNRIYFQPLHNLNNHTPVHSQKLSSILAVARRRHSLQHIGLEIFFKDVNVFTKSSSAAGFPDGGSAFFTFFSVQERDVAADRLLEQLQGQTGLQSSVGSLLEKDSSWLDRVTAAWQAGHISNYDYLMYLNLVAGRTRCDLAQWPVMPWVLKDYENTTLNLKDPETFRDLSKPIGALNPSRLAIFRERYQQMLANDSTHRPFLYGTHYSTPGYVLYWLVRAAPAHMLRLQNGRFDTPDRLFFSISESWYSVFTNQADVKELIPEFYALPSTFLVSRTNLNLGVRQNGIPVEDVILPPWAKDPDDFVIKHRRALECKHVSMNIQSWIDLIFGYKQQGEAAFEAHNVFHQLTYEGAVDLEKIEDPFERMSLEAQINEFGQAPQQLFTGPHPARCVTENFDHFDEHKRTMLEGNGGDSCSAMLSCIMSKTVLFETGASDPAHEAAEPERVKAETIEVRVPEVLEGYPAMVSPQSESRYEDDEPLTCAPLTPQIGCSTPHTPELDVNRYRRARMNSRKALGSSFDSSEGDEQLPWTLKRVTDTQPWRIHREPVNAVIISDDNASESLTLYCASKGGLIKVYSISEGFQIRATKLGNLPISSLALTKNSDAYPTVLAGSFDNCVYAYSVDYGRSLGKIRAHDDSVSCVRMSGSKLATASWDATVKLWSLDEGRGGWMNSGLSASGGPSETELFEHESAIWSLDIDTTGDIVVSGAEDGTITLWDVRAKGCPMWTCKNLSGAASGLRMSADGQELMVASTSGFLYAIEMRQGGSVVSQKCCETPLRSCDIVEDMVLAGSFSGELHFWPWRMDPGGSSNTSLRNHSDAITSVGIGARHGVAVSVATASEDCTIQVYDIERSM